MKRCEHAMLKGLCVVQSCPHWDGVRPEQGQGTAPTLRACVRCGKVKRRSLGKLCGRCGRRGKVAA